MKLSDIFYEDQTDWTIDQFYQLTRNMNRIFYLRNRKKEEFNSLDLGRMSLMTKTIMAALTRNERDKLLWDTKQFSELKDIQPLTERFNLVTEPANGTEGFLYYNLGW